MTDVDPRVEKIRKLLEKADRTDVAAEADTYREKAYDLMVRGEIDEAQLSAASAERLKTERVVQGTLHLAWPKSYAYEFVSALLHAAQGAGLRAFMQPTYYDHEGKLLLRGDKTWRVLLVGFESDVERFRLLADLLFVQLVAAQRRYAKTIPSYYSASQRWNLRRSFLKGWGREVERRLKALRTQAVAEASTGTDLVLRDKGAQLDAWINENMELGNGRPRKSFYEGERAGSRAGASADIGQSRFGQGARGALEG